MAKKVVVQLIDDVNGESADETVSFALDGVSYEIDLTTKNAAALRADLEKWIPNARRAGGRRTQRAAGRASSERTSDAAKIREWAREQGIQISDRGRIPAELRERYAAEA